MASIAAFCLAPGIARAADAATISAAEIVELATSGQPVELDAAVVKGDLDLRAMETIPKVFRCTNCTFRGVIRASNVIFDRVVDLSGSTLEAGATFDGAIFHDSFLMRVLGDRPARIQGTASFSLAAFDGRANFDGAQFESDADFRVVQFGGDTSFADTSFAEVAQFDSATFDGRTQFNGSSPSTAAFGGPATFTTATFRQKVDFRQRSFGGEATFDGASFDTADFTLAVFGSSATFDDASFEGPATFSVVMFMGPLSFERVVLLGPSTFEAATMLAPADFSRTSSSDHLSLKGLIPAGLLTVNGFSASDLEMDLERLDRIRGDGVQIEVLAMIEEAARARGDIGTANEAVFKRNQLETDRASGPTRIFRQLDENIGGYLVQPLTPLRAIVFLLIAGTVVRAIARLTPGLSQRRAIWDLAPATTAASGGNATAEIPPEPVSSELSTAGGSPSVLLRVSKAIATVVRAFADTARAAVRLRPQDIPERRRDDLAAYGAAFLAGAEWLAYKLLFALFLIGLANSNPTFKQLVEAVT